MEMTNKLNIDYKTSKIYKIFDMAYTEQYIGSTVQALSARMSKHRLSYKLYKEGKAKFCSSFLLFDKYGVDACKIELLEEYPCATKEPVRKREGHYIQLSTCINKRIAGRTDKEYRDAHKDKHKEYLKEYHIINKERKRVKDKEYREKNKDRLLQQKKQYYEVNKTRINEERSQQQTCPLCGSTYAKSNKGGHERTNKHQQALSKEPEPETQ